MFKFLIVLLFSLQILTQANVSYSYDIPPPPVKGSAADREDFRILHIYQDRRTPEQCRAADLQSHPSVDGMFGPNTGILTASEVRMVASQSDQLIRKVFSITDPFKDLYLRMRPYNEDSTLHPCILMPGGSRAYPSGHSAVGIVLADFLAKKFPAKRDRILAQGKQVGINRLIGGVHHPSDVVAGQSLGRQIVLEQFNEE